MTLRYKGKPYAGANKQADKLEKLCFCKFVSIGYPLDATKCQLHVRRTYQCGECSCLNYRPAAVKKSPGHWPLCVCGHIAQEHN